MQWLMRLVHSAWSGPEELAKQGLWAHSEHLFYTHQQRSTLNTHDFMIREDGGHEFM